MDPLHIRKTVYKPCITAYIQLLHKAQTYLAHLGILIELTGEVGNIHALLKTYTYLTHLPEAELRAVIKGYVKSPLYAFFYLIKLGVTID